MNRLEMAERVCVLFGWTGSRSETVKDKALAQAWQEWASTVPEGFLSPKEHPELDEEAIATLAAKRDEIRAQTLALIRGERDG
jgi:hypothetical protein